MTHKKQIPWIAIDTETQGLNPKKFLMGCIMRPDGNSETFDNLPDMLNRIDDYASMRNGVLTIYAHYMPYDYTVLRQHENPRNNIYSTRPFIADTHEPSTGNAKIKWIDTMNLFPHKLSRLGEMIGNAKGNTPEWLKLDEYEPTHLELDEARRYMIQDCNVITTYLNTLRRRLKAEGIAPRILVTRAQIASQHFMKWLRKHEKPQHYIPHEKRWTGIWMKNIDTGELYPTQHADTIHKALRGGRNEAWQTGWITDVSGVDVNGLYPYAAGLMDAPDLRSEREDIDITKPGVTTALLECPSIPLGYLPIRTGKTATSYPVSDEEPRYLYGTWTNLELQRATTLGYRILLTTYGITYEHGINPFGQYFREQYARRQAAQSDEERGFYKMLMNGLIGKLAQRRELKTVKLISRDDLPEWIAEGYEAKESFGDEVLIERNEGPDPKRSYCPIYTALITAQARDVMYTHYCKLPRDSLVYTDTDSIYATGDIHTTFIINNDLGAFKSVADHEEAHIYGRKARRVGSDIALNRVPKTSVTKELFDNGAIPYTDMDGPQKRGLAGQRHEQLRILNEETHDEEQRLLIDHHEEPDGTTLKRIITTVTKERTTWATRKTHSEHSSSAS